MHKIDKLLVATLLVTAAPIALYIFFYRQLPAQIPVHFTATFRPNGYAPKNWAIWVSPALFVALQLYIYFQKYKLDKKLFYAWAIPALSVLVQVGILLYVLLR